MEPKKDIPTEESEKEAGSQTPVETPQAPADALSRTPEDLKEEEEKLSAADDTAEEPTAKKISPLKQVLRKVNVYLLVFILLIVVAGAITIVNYLNSQKTPNVPTISEQGLTEDALKQLANSDASVGSSSQTLTIQGSAIIAGQTLMRGNLNVAGNLQTGGTIQGPSLTISGSANIGDAQINSLQVASNAAVQGTTTMRDINVSGTSSFSGAMTASQITVTRLVLSGNASLDVPNHIRFSGPSPNRTINQSVLGNGGTSSVSGSDTSGTITVNTGNNPTAGCFSRIVFQQTFTNQPHVIVSPVGVAAGQTQFYVERTNTGFNICTAIAAPANQAFAYDYFVTN